MSVHRFGLALIIPAILIAAAATPAAAQASFPITVLLSSGDPVPDVGLVTLIENLAVNRGGDWIVQVDTDGNGSMDQVLIKNGVMLLREGDPMTAPAGATLGSFDSVNINASGNGGWNIFIDGPPISMDSGIYFNASLVFQESHISTAPEFSPGTPYIGFFDSKLNDANEIAIVASVDDVAIPSTVDRALVIVTVDGSGALLSESVLAKEGEALPGQTQLVVDFGTGPHQSAFNNRGQMLYFVDMDGPTTTDGVIYLDRAVVAREGTPSAVAGRNYETLSTRGLDLNDPGEAVFKANLDGDASTDEMIVVDGSELIREGGSVPVIAPNHFTAFGVTSGPVAIDNVRNVLWWGDWDNPDTTKDTGLFLNDVLIVHENGTSVGPRTITAIANGEDAFTITDDGRYVAFEATLDDGGQGAFRMEIQGPRPVPDGRIVAGVQARAAKNVNGVDIDVTWDATACPDPDYNLFFGDLAAVSTLTYSGSACSLGASGQATFTPPAGNVFWIVAGEGAAGIEGGHGFDSAGRARRAAAGGMCGAVHQIRSALCP